MCVFYNATVNVGLVYEPTIVNACVYQVDDASARLNIQWKVTIKSS